MDSQYKFALIVAILGLVVTSPVPSDQEEVGIAKRQTFYCIANGQKYKPGDNFTIGNNSCVKYLCTVNGPKIIEEGCNVGGQCRPVNETFDNKCVTYKCLVTDLGNGRRRYEVVIEQQLCKDAYGQCRNPGEFFPFIINGTTWQNCTCEPAVNHTVTYRCQRGA